MQDGRVGEYGSPKALLGDLADTTGEDVFTSYQGEDESESGSNHDLFRDLWAQHLSSRRE